MNGMFASGWISTLIPHPRRKNGLSWPLLASRARTQIGSEKTPPVFAPAGQPTLGLHAQNTFSCRNTKKRKKNSNRQQKKTPPKLNHVFVFGILISPQTGTRIPCVRPYYTENYCKQRAAKATPRRPAPVFRTQADIAADMIRSVRVPTGSRVLVLGDTAFEAKQIRAACRQRGQGAST